jgi:hypothetical protein
MRYLSGRLRQQLGLEVCDWGQRRDVFEAVISEWRAVEALGR